MNNENRIESFDNNTKNAQSSTTKKEEEAQQSSKFELVESKQSNSNINDNNNLPIETMSNLAMTSKQADNIVESKDDCSSSSSSLNTQQKVKIIKKKVFIDNIEWMVHENLLEKFFSKYGKIKKSKIIRDSYTNKSKGFGYVEFMNESDALNLLNAKPEELVLKERQMNVRPFIEKQKHVTKKKILKITNVDTNEDWDQMPNGPSKQVAINQENCFINELPIDLISNIFNRLCLRDLCIVELVCKKWYEIARMVWSLKRKLIFDNKNIFDKYETASKNPYGFCIRPVFNEKSLKQILNKKFGPSLRHVDISPIAQNFGPLSLQIIVDECPNLTYLNISKYNVSNYNFRHIKKLTKLKELNLAYCSQITDTSLSKVFQSCKYLESVEMTFCHLVVGRCFTRSPLNLKNLKIDQCENIEDQYLIQLFSHNKNFVNLSMKRSKPYSLETLLLIINNLSKLESLNLSESGFSSCSTDYDVDNLNFENLKSLKSLDLSCSNSDSKLIQKLLKTSSTLKSIDISYCMKVNDELFNGLSIKPPIEELNLSFVKQITDLTLESICQLSNTLKTLKIKGCSKLTTEGIAKTLIKMSNLVCLDVRNNFQINNFLLETALSIDNKDIFILCNDTDIDTVEFEYKYPETTKELIDRNYYQFKYKNLKFESTMTNRLDKKNELRIWQENGFYYIGSPSESEDGENFEFDTNENGYFNRNYLDNYEYEDDEADDDDLEEMFEEEQEMYKELQ